MAMHELLAAQQCSAAAHRAWPQPRPAMPEASMSAAGPGSTVPSGLIHMPPTPPNPFMAATNPFATAPPRAGGQPWGGLPCVPLAAPGFSPFAVAAPPQQQLQGLPDLSAALHPALARPAVQRQRQPTDPFAAVGHGRCDWDFTEQPNCYDGDGFDSDTTDFCSQPLRVPFARSGGLGLFTTDDQVHLLADLADGGKAADVRWLHSTVRRDVVSRNVTVECSSRVCALLPPCPTVALIGA